MDNDNGFKKFFDESLTEEEKIKIEKVFCADEVMYNAVKKVLLNSVYTSGTLKKGLSVDPQVNAAFSLASLASSNPIPDAEIGANVRAQWAGISYLVNGFEMLETIKGKTVETEKTTVNEGV